jgi:CubicO group peptidase (beta-lactamase class C family)
MNTRMVTTRRIAFVGMLLAAIACAAQPQLPDTPAGRQFSGWLAAFNGGDRATFQKFLETNYPDAASSVDSALAFRQQTGGFDVRKIEESAPLHLSVIVQERNSDTFARCIVDVQPTEGHRIMAFDLRAIRRPAEFPAPRMTEAEATAALRVRLEQDTAADRFAGAVLVARNGKPIFTGAYGLADREKKIANRLDTKFRIGSMNKMFTAVAVLQLVQAGKIKLADPVGKYITDYPNKDVATRVTIHHLLTHSGGTGDIFGPEFTAHRLELRTLQDYMKLYGSRGVKYEPGSLWEYSNYGFILLGVVIEKVTGQSYYDYVREHIFKPAGMTSTDSLPENEPVPGRAVGYMRPQNGKERSTNADTLPYRGTSAGGGYSTVEDLMRFATAIESNKLLDAHHTELLTVGKTEIPSGDKYAYGFVDKTATGLHCFGHAGGAPGMNGDLEICPQTGYVIAVLSNLPPPGAEAVVEFISNRLPEK